MMYHQFSPAELTILVVDDEATVRTLLARVLVKGQYRVLEAAGAAEALHLSETSVGTIDLLIADHALNFMTGRQVAEQIRQSHPGLKVLQISGYPAWHLESEGGLMPDAEFLQKPFSSTDLLAKVRQLLMYTEPLRTHN